MQNAGCFSCFEPYYNVKIQTNIDKILYFPDEKVSLEMIVDNRESQRRIQNISCYLRQTIRILKDKNDERKGWFWSKSYDLHRIQINKGNFANMINKIDKTEDNKRVYGKFNLQFNLSKILQNIKNLASLEGKERASYIRKKSIQQTGMSGVGTTGAESTPKKETEGSQINFQEPAATGKKNQPLPFQEDAQAAAEFEKQLYAFLDEITELTPYTISGLSLSSQFSIAVKIEMMPVGLFGGANLGGEEEIPIIIRSQKDGNHIHDLMKLQVTELKSLSKVVEQKYSFIQKPFQLAGCNLGNIGEK